MHTIQLSLQAVPTGALAAEVRDLIGNHHGKVHGHRTSVPTPAPVAIHLANFLVHSGHWTTWQKGIGALWDLQLQALPREVAVASPPVVQKVAQQDCWGFNVLDDCLRGIVAGIQDLELQNREPSGGLPFLSILAGPTLKTAGEDLLVEITKLIHAGPLELKPKVELVSGKVQPANLRRNLTPYQLPVAAVLKAYDSHPGPTPPLRLLTHA